MAKCLTFERTNWDGRYKAGTVETGEREYFSFSPCVSLNRSSRDKVKIKSSN